MKMTIDVNDMMETFRRIDRDYWTYDGLETLLDYYNEIDENMEFDPIAICCECSEYGNGATLSFEDMVNDYDYLLDRDEWMEDNDETEFDIDLYIESLVEVLEDHTTVLKAANGNYIVFAF